MLRQCVVLCPEDLWTAGRHPRTYWRIAFHATFFTQLYLGQDQASFQTWPGRRPDLQRLWEAPDEIEPYEMPEGVPPCTRGEIINYIDFVDGLVDSCLDSLDLDTDKSGFAWYPRTPKLAHLILNIRHVQGHVGQLSELLMARDIDIDWVS